MIAGCPQISTREPRPCAFRGGRLVLDALSALYAFLRAVLRLRPCPRRCQEQQHRGRVQQQCHGKDEPRQRILQSPPEIIQAVVCRSGSPRKALCYPRDILFF